MKAGMGKKYMSNFDVIHTIKESVQKVGQYWRECYLEGGQPPGNYLAILEGEAIIALWPVMHPIASKWCGKVQ